MRLYWASPTSKQPETGRIFQCDFIHIFPHKENCSRFASQNRHILFTPVSRAKNNAKNSRRTRLPINAKIEIMSSTKISPKYGTEDKNSYTSVVWAIIKLTENMSTVSCQCGGTTEVETVVCLWQCRVGADATPQPQHVATVTE